MFYFSVWYIVIKTDGILGYGCGWHLLVSLMFTDMPLMLNCLSVFCCSTLTMAVTLQLVSRQDQQARSLQPTYEW